MRQTKNKNKLQQITFLSSDPFCVRLPWCLLCVVTSVRVYRMTLYLLVSVFTG